MCGTCDDGPRQAGGAKVRVRNSHGHGDDRARYESREVDHGDGGGALPHDVAAGAAARLTSALTTRVSLVRNHRRRRPDGPGGAPRRPNSVVACGVYADGRRTPGKVLYTDALRHVHERGGGFAWLGLYEPYADELTDIARAYGLHPLAVEDAVDAHQRPKLELYDDSLFMVFKTARYVDHERLTATSDVVETGEVMVFVGEDFVVTVRHGRHGGLRAMRAQLEAVPEQLRRGPAAVLHAIADRVVDDFLRVTERMQDDIDEIERSVFDRSVRPDTGRVYQLKRELLELKHATFPLATPLRALADGTVALVPAEVREYFRDVADHLERLTMRISGFDELLDSILTATLTQVTIAQNEDMRRISAWVAIAAVPTMVAGIYGMNFKHMPELRWTYGYPAVLAGMATVCLLLFRAFKRNGWL
jgi:magnesium transporter